MQYLNKSFRVFTGGNNKKMNIMSNVDRAILGLPLDEGLPEYKEVSAIEGGTNDKPRIVDQNKNPIVLKTYQKNGLYDKAKALREEIRGGLCRRDECDRPTDRNVQKMLRSEFPMKRKIDEYKKCMKAIGADPRDYDVEKLRRR